ncbi:MAG: HAD family hydrolase [Oleiphilaceae bacterium]|nr:HAD family hydrolase [Oleiphilaceae bacterium]
MSEQLNELASNIQLLALDVDGVMTDGKLYFSAQGDEIKAFNILDGHGIKMLLKNGIQVAIITGRNSPLTARRARDLGIEHLIQGREDKKFALLELCDTLDIDIKQTAYLGDDLPDLGAIVTAGLGMCVANAHPFVKQHANFQTTLPGGSGAVREVCDLLLEARGLLADLHQAYLL